MDREDLYRSFNEVDDEVIQRSEKVSPNQHAKKPFFTKRFAAIAACIAIFMGITLTTEAANGEVSNLFAPLFGFAQAEIVDTIGHPIGASASADGYILTAEAMVGDRYNVAVIYTLKREDGQPITDNLYFQDWETDILSGTGGGGSLYPISDEENPGQITFVELWSGTRSLFGRYVTVSFSNLSIYDGEEDHIIADGPWELNYTVRYKDSTTSVPVDPLQVVTEEERTYQVNEILLSPIGIHMQGIYFDPVWGEQNTLKDLKVSIRKKNGEIITFENAGGGCSFAQNAPSAKIHFEAMFQEPVPLDEMESLIICNAEIPIQ